MKLVFHGGASEVGRSCIQVRGNNGARYLLDVGVKFKENGFLLPEKVLDIPKLQGVFLSHAHLDHSGGLPLFEHKDLKGPIFCTRQTFELTRILLKDSYKIARIRNLHPAYNKTDLKEVKKDTLLVRFNKWYKHENVRFMYLNAAHIPGSSMVLMELDGKRLLYTGDFNNRKSRLMKPLEISPYLLEKPIDALICESTYGDRGLPDRDALERDLVKTIKDSINKGGSVVIPVFALGRAQELLIMLGKTKFNAPIYMDGMCKTVTNRILVSPSEYVDNKELLEDVYRNRVQRIGSPKRRKDAMTRPGIFITTSGMMQGGPVLEYVKEFWHDSNSAILLMGFQCKRTNGRHLIDEGFVYLDGWKTFVKCKVKKYDFSGHADVQGIKDFVKAINPRNVFFNHGDVEAINVLKKWADKNLSGKAFAPKVLDSYDI